MTVEQHQSAYDGDARDGKPVIKVQPAPEVLRHVVDQLRSSGNAAFKAGRMRGSVSDPSLLTTAYLTEGGRWHHRLCCALCCRGGAAVHSSHSRSAEGGCAVWQPICRVFGLGSKDRGLPGRREGNTTQPRMAQGLLPARRPLLWPSLPCGASARPADVALQCRLGMACMALHDYSMAIRALATGVRLEPGNSDMAARLSVAEARAEYQAACRRAHVGFHQRDLVLKLRGVRRRWPVSMLCMLRQPPQRMGNAVRVLVCGRQGGRRCRRAWNGSSSRA